MPITVALLLAAKAAAVTPGLQIQGLRPMAYAAAPTGSKVLVTLEDGGVRIFDAASHQTVRTLAKHKEPANAAAWSPDGFYVATGDETARIWIEDTRSGAKVREYRTHIRGIQKLSFNMQSRYIASTGKDDEIKVYDLESKSPKEMRGILGKGANFYGGTFSPKQPFMIGTAILAAGGGRLYDAKSGQVTGFLVGHDEQGANDVAFSPQGTRIATAGKDGTVSVLDAKTLKKVGTLRGHGDFVVTAAFSPNGRLLATGSVDRTVKVWDTVTMQKVADIPSQSSVGSPVAFTSDGKTLLTVSDQGFLQINSVSPAQAGSTVTTAVPVKTKAKKRHH